MPKKKRNGSYVVEDLVQTTRYPEDDHRVVMGHTTSCEKAHKLIARCKHNARVTWRPDDDTRAIEFTPREYPAEAHRRAAAGDNGCHPHKLDPWHGLLMHGGLIPTYPEGHRKHSSQRTKTVHLVQGLRDRPSKRELALERRLNELEARLDTRAQFDDGEDDVPVATARPKRKKKTTARKKTTRKKRAAAKT